MLARRFAPLGRGVVAGAVGPEGEAFFCAGDALGPGTIFEIGSITKTLTATLLAGMVAEGEVAADDPIDRFLPRAARPGAYRGRRITLRDLATHTSGLPRLPRNLLAGALLHWRDPCAGYTEADLERALGRSSATRHTGRRYRYSNFGFAVLGHVLARAASCDYGTLVAERVCRPLGMHETWLRVPEADRQRRAGGHRWGWPVPDWHLCALAGAGGLRSTAADLLRFLGANLAPERTPLRAALEAAQAAWHRIGPGAAIGLGWPHRTEGGRRLTWHHGATGGFLGVVAFDRAAGVGVVALTNSVPLIGMPLDGAAFAALRELSGGSR